VVDPTLQMKYQESNGVSNSMVLNPSFFGPHVEKLVDFQSNNSQFLLYEQLSENPDWILSTYTDEGAQIQLLKIDQGKRWYLVSGPHDSAGVVGR
jgi:hypothetical protein